MPAYGLNRLFAELPIIGILLGNGNDRGLIGITWPEPSGGGGEYEELIFKICATNVGSLGIQFPITVRPPGSSWPGK